MKNISLQYRDLQEGKMNRHQFLRNARMMFPNHVTQFNSFEDSVKILKSKGLLNEGNAVKGTPDKAPTYEYPNEETKYMKVVQEPEVDEQDGIYPATSVTKIPKEKMDKKVKDKSDGLEPIKDKDTKNELKKVKIVKESKKNLTENKATAKQIQDKYNEMFGKNPQTTFADVAKALGISEQEIAFTLLAPDLAKNFSLREDEGKFDPKQRQKDDLKKFSNKMRDQVQGGAPKGVNTLKDKIKDMVREVLNEMYDDDVAEFDVDTERYDDGGTPRMSDLITTVVDEFNDYQKSNDIDLENEVKESNLNDFISRYIDNIGYGVNDDYYNILFYGVQDELKRLGYKFI
jgi:hypothetical protein